MEQSDFKHFTGIEVSMDPIGGYLIPLIRRFDILEIQEHSGISRQDTHIYVHQLLKSLSNGTYDLKTGKQIDMTYSVLSANRIVDGKLMLFWELNGIEGTPIWKNSRHSFNFSKGFLIERENYFACLTFQINTVSIAHQVVFTIDIISEFNAEIIAQHCRRGYSFRKKKNKTECLNLVREKNWEGLQQHLV